MPQTSGSQTDIGSAIVKAVVAIQGYAGATLTDVKDHLSSLWSTVPELEVIQSHLDNAVEKGILIMENGKYKVKEKVEENIGSATVKAVAAIEGHEGATLNDVKDHLSSFSSTVPELEVIQSHLDNAVEKGFLIMENGKYKVKEKEKEKGFFAKVKEKFF